MNTVGKDFIFEFALPEYQQYSFNFKSCFGIFASFVGPYMGYYIYEWSGKSFFVGSLIVSCFYLVALVLFLIFFYIDYHPEEIEEKNKL